MANELKLKLGIRVSPRTVGKYRHAGPVRAPDPQHRWLTFVHNHGLAWATLARNQWGLHDNRGRPHSSLGPGIPEPSQDWVAGSDHRHRLSAGYRIVKRSVLGGLHHEYRLVKEAG
jgi:hypothetical protein